MSVMSVTSRPTLRPDVGGLAVRADRAAGAHGERFAGGHLVAVAVDLRVVAVQRPDEFPVVPQAGVVVAHLEGEVEAAGAPGAVVLRRDLRQLRPLAVHLQRHLPGACDADGDGVAVPPEDRGQASLCDAIPVVGGNVLHVSGVPHTRRAVVRLVVYVLCARVEDANERLVEGVSSRINRHRHLHCDGVASAAHRRLGAAVCVRRHFGVDRRDEDRVVRVGIVGDPERPVEERVLRLYPRVR